MAQAKFFSAVLTMSKTITRRRPFILLAIFIFVVILTFIINSNNSAHPVIEDAFYAKHSGQQNKFHDEPNDNFRKLEPNHNPSLDGKSNTIKRLQVLENPALKAVTKESKLKWYVPTRRIVHFDLKGAAPKVEYIDKVFPLLKKGGATGILLEWEDMFPFEGELAMGKHKFAYTKDDVHHILESAKRNNLEVIPLIQSFGHLEFFLKLQEYRSLRENDIFPQAICPQKPDAFKLVTQIIDQVMALHKDAKFLHIGGDEVFQLGMCEKCRQVNRDELFLNHVIKVAKYVKNKYRIQSIMWDDMLRQFADYTLNKYDFEAAGLEVMVWTYIDDIYRFIPEETFNTFSQYIPKIWGASAFKGAFGETLMVPNAKMHYENNVAWLDALKQQSKHFDVRGLVITGWQRYDHLGNLCELFPAGLPSLMLDLITISNGFFDSRLFHDFDTILNCQYSPEEQNIKRYLLDDPFFFQKNCNFPGHEVFRMVKNAKEVFKKIDDYLYDVTTHKAWLTDFNEAHNITNPMRIQEALQNYPSHFMELKMLISQAYMALTEVYEEYTAKEWIEQKIYPYVNRMEKFLNRTQKLDKLRVWPRRPVKTIEDLERFLPKIKKTEDTENTKNEI